MHSSGNGNSNIKEQIVLAELAWLPKKMYLMAAHREYTLKKTNTNKTIKKLANVNR